MNDSNGELIAITGKMSPETVEMLQSLATLVFGDKIRKLRTKVSLTQQALANKVD
ncbi:hypothetical protein ACFLWU_01530 [Chloroflexota bacterium]